MTPIALNRLTRHQIERMISHIAHGKALPPEVVEQLVTKTDGVPLFVEELTKTVLETGHLREADDRNALTGALPSLAIPTTLQDSLMARLDRLETAKSVAQLGAVIGRQFSYGLLRAVSQLDEETLHRELSRLVDAEILYQHGVVPQASYTFKHALIQDAAYQSLLKSTRQQQHQRIAQELEQQFPETAAHQPELLAHHYAEAGRNELAIAYWRQAGERAVQRSAHMEAIGLFSNGLNLIELLPDTPERTKRELSLYIAMASPLWVTKGMGAPEVRQVYARARALCQQIGETPHLFPALWGLSFYYSSQMEFHTAQELGEQCLRLAQETQDPGLLLQAYHAIWPMAMRRGDFVLARHLQEQAITLYDTTRHHDHTALYGGHDPGACALQHGAVVLWMLGYPEQALLRSHSALTLTQNLAHPFSRLLAYHWAAILHGLRREPHEAKEQAEAAMQLCTEQGVQLWLFWATLLRGKALSELGQHAEGVAQMCQGLAAYKGTGTGAMAQGGFLALLAEAYGQAGQLLEGLNLVNEALTQVHHTGERQHEAELHRLKGDFLLQRSSDNHTEAETCFHQALAVARGQQAKSWELRAAMSLSRLWQRQGKHTEARQLLADVYNWFTEAFDTVDLQEAKALLDELS